jgi:hypothetical protein
VVESISNEDKEAVQSGIEMKRKSAKLLSLINQLMRRKLL